MFEKYTEAARRSIFFARYEASHFGSRQIEPTHLLLAIMRVVPELAREWIGDDQGIARRAISSRRAATAIRREDPDERRLAAERRLQTHPGI